MIESCSFSQVLPFWKAFLWPERESPIEPNSAISSDGSINCALLEHPVQFFRYLNINGEVLGVISLQETGDCEFRSRGIWVREDCRQRGLGRQLISKVFEVVEEQRGQRLWTMPRESALPFYLKLGFSVYGETSEYEYGHHYLVDRRF